MEKPWKAKVDEKFFVVDSVNARVVPSHELFDYEQRRAIRAGNAYEKRADAKSALDSIKKFFAGVEY